MLSLLAASVDTVSFRKFERTTSEVITPIECAIGGLKALGK